MAAQTFTRLKPETQIVELLDRQDFNLNGVHFIRHMDSGSLLSQAHAVLAFITAAASEAGSLDDVAPNETITLEALAAAQSLLEIGIWRSNLERAIEH